MQANRIKIAIGQGLFLREYEAADVAALALYLNNKEVSSNTLRIPHPYTEDDACNWVSHIMEQKLYGHRADNFVIAARDGLIGAIGIELNEVPEKKHCAEIGYWLAKPFWNLGYATKAVGAFSKWALQHFMLEKLVAVVYTENTASCRVLEKNHFRLEGTSHRHLKKGYYYKDCKIYGLLKEWLPNE